MKRKLTVMEYLCQKLPRICSTCRKHFPHSSLITGFVIRVTRRVSLVEQELLTLSERLSSPMIFSGVRVTRSLLLCVCFVDHCLSFCPFSFGHCVVCSSSTYGFRLPLWYLQTLLTQCWSPISTHEQSPLTFTCWIPTKHIHVGKIYLEEGICLDKNIDKSR
jgi:hypothetical protein